MNYLEFFTIDKWTMIFTWVNMFILLAMLKKFLFNPVNKIIDRREAEVNKMVDDAKAANERAASMEREYTEKMANARDQAGEIIKQATLTAKKREDEIIDDAHKQARIITRRAETEIEQERKKAYQEIRNDIADISISIAEKMVNRELSASDHEDLINRFIENVGE